MAVELITRVASAAGTGDVVGPSSAVNDRIAVFDGTTGKLLKDGGSSIADIVAGSGGLVTSVFGRTGAIVAATNDYTFAQINKATSSIGDLTTRSAGDLSSGTLLAARMPALSGDVVTNVGTIATSISDNVVTLAKMADIATASFLGRNTAGTGDPEVLSIATAKTMLSLTGTNSGDVTLAGQNYLSIAGQVITANAVHLGSTNVTGTLTVDKGGTGTATTFTTGSIVFAGASGVYTQDNANLFWDDSNNHLGVGVTTPQQNVHIKDTNPSLRLEDTTASNIGEFTVISNLVGIGANRNNVTGAPFNTGKTTAYIFMLAASSNSQILFGTTPTNNTDPIQRMMIDKDGKVGIGPGSPSQLFEVTGNVFINSATANLYMKDASTGWQAAATTVITPQASNAIRSTTYTSGLVGWNISALGDAEFNNVDVRGAIHASIFTYNAINATAGTLGVFKSAAKLRTDVVVPAGPTYGTTTVNIDVVDADGLTHAASQLFVVNDILRLKDGLVGDTWFKVSSVSDQTTFWRYTAIIMAGTNNVTYRAGMGVPDYGLSGQGFIIQTADQTNAPYLQMATHAATFSSSDASGTLVLTPRLRLGNLNGSYGYATNIYGFGTGQYGTAGQSWLTVDPTNGVRIGNNTTVLTQVDAAGNASFTGSITASSGTIAGWTISSTRLSNSTTHIASGFDLPSGQVAWFGRAAAGYQGWVLRDSGNREARSLADGTVYPYTAYFDATRWRIVLGGLNTAWGSDGSTNSIGMKIWDSSGNLLVHFSDVANQIAGWAISSTKISSTGIDIHSGASAALAFGSTPPTSASAGTGIWLDRTGLFGLSGGTVQAKLDAINGKIVAGAGDVILDSGGISIFGDASAKTTATIKFRDAAGGTNGQADINYRNFGTGGEVQAYWTTLGNENTGFASLTLTAQHAGTGQAAGVVARSYGPSHATLASKKHLFVFAGNGVVATDSTFNAAPASVVLEVQSTTGAFLPPRMTTTQRDALTPTDGMILYNSTLATMQYRKAGAWVSI